MSRVKHSKQQIADAVSSYTSDGTSMKLVMAIFNVSHSVLRRWLSAAGVSVERRGRRDKYAIDLDVLKGMCDAGKTEREMALEFGCSQGVIRRRKYDLGLLGDGKGW